LSRWSIVTIVVVLLPHLIVRRGNS